MTVMMKLRVMTMFVVGSRPCSMDFSPGTPVFLPPEKPSKFQFHPGRNLSNKLPEFLGAPWVNKLLLRFTMMNLILVVVMMVMMMMMMMVVVVVMAMKYPLTKLRNRTLHF